MSSPVLTAAPPARNRPVASVLIAGLSTSIFALFGVWSLNALTDDFNIMGWYAWYVLPVGALLVGALSAAGYGLASWRSGVKISRELLWAVLGLQVAAYFAAQYMQFQDELSARQALGYGAELGFLQWFDEVARSFSWKQRQGVGSPLGAWGYAFRGLEIAGFALGGWLVPLALSAKPYCDDCQRYRRALKQLVLPMGTMEPSPAGDDVVDAALQGLLELVAQVQADQPLAYREVLERLKRKKKSLRKSRSHLQVYAHVCPSCTEGYLAPRVVTQEGQNVRQQDLEGVWLSAEFGEALLGRR